MKKLSVILWLSLSNVVAYSNTFAQEQTFVNNTEVTVEYVLVPDSILTAEQRQYAQIPETENPTRNFFASFFTVIVYFTTMYLFFWSYKNNCTIRSVPNEKSFDGTITYETIEPSEDLFLGHITAFAVFLIFGTLFTILVIIG